MGWLAVVTVPALSPQHAPATLALGGPTHGVRDASGHFGTVGVRPIERKTFMR